MLLRLVMPKVLGNIWLLLLQNTDAASVIVSVGDHVAAGEAVASAACLCYYSLPVLL